MPKAEPPLRGVPRPVSPSRYDGRNDETCGLCDEPIGDAATCEMHCPGDHPDVWRVVHARCVHERAMIERALASRN
jgi:hypothetical protein